MSILNPISTPIPVAQSSTVPVTNSEERQVGLRPEQMVRATVVEGGLDRALLEMNNRHYRAQSGVALQAGQKLTLQVLQTQPTLEFRVINDPLGARLSQLLPLLTQQYDWTRLLEVLRQQPQQQGLPQNTAQVYQQLTQLLQPNGQLPAAVESQLGALPVQLQQLFVSVSSGQGSAEPLSPAVQGTHGNLFYRTDSGGQQNLHQLVRGLQEQFSQLLQADGRPLPQAWLTQTQNLLVPLQQGVSPAQTPLPQVNDLFVVLGQMRQQPNLPPQLSSGLERLVLQLSVQVGRELPVAGQAAGQTVVLSPVPAAVAPPAPLVPRQAAQLPPSGQAVNAGGQPLPGPSAQSAAGFVASEGVYRPPVAPSSPFPAQSPAVIPEEVSAGLEKLLVQVQQMQGKAAQISPELLGRLEGLLDKLHQLPEAVRSGQVALPGLELITAQLSQLVQQGPQQPQGGQLGFLSQLFGFHLEAELLQGKKKEALASLKLSLLSLSKELGAEVEEPLRRLEMLQLCKAKLAEEQVQFLPLPFNELEEGYLLMEKRRQADDEAAADQPLQLTLSLRLSALGNMRVDMLYEKDGLHLRMACEDEEKMAYLQNHLPELKESIETVPLQGVSFSADAQVPVRQLLERLLPDSPSMLDDRI